ncbi:MAG: DUF4116 domain-containing protein [bacterium]
MLEIVKVNYEAFIYFNDEIKNCIEFCEKCLY